MSNSNQIRFLAPTSDAAKVVRVNGTWYATIPRTISGVGCTLTLNNVYVPTTYDEIIETFPGIQGESILRITGDLYFPNAVALSADGSSFSRSGGMLGRTQNTVAVGWCWINEEGTAWHFEPTFASATFEALGIIAGAPQERSTCVSCNTGRRGECLDVIDLSSGPYYEQYMNDSFSPRYPDLHKNARYSGGIFGTGSNGILQYHTSFTTARIPPGAFNPYAGFQYSTGAMNYFGRRDGVYITIDA